MGEYNYGPLEHEMAGGTFAECNHQGQLVSYTEDGQQFIGCRGCEVIVPRHLFEVLCGRCGGWVGKCQLYGHLKTGPTDSFGTPRTKQVWVGRTVGDRNAKVPFRTVAEAERFIAQLEVFYPDEVHAGNFYIDGWEGRQ